MTQLSVQKIVCPICSASIDNINLPKAENGINIIAIDHKDHVLIIKYDNANLVREITAKKIYKEELSQRYLECPKCKDRIPIPQVSNYPTEITYKHNDHISVIYIFDEDVYIVDSIKLIEIKKDEKTSNKLSEITSDNILAYILTEIAAGNNYVSIPKQFNPEIFKIYLETIGIKNVKIERAHEENIEINEERIQFFKTIITKNKNKPTLMNKIESAFKLIDKITGIILRVYLKDEFKPTLEQLKELLERKKLKYIIKTRLRNLAGLEYQL